MARYLLLDPNGPSVTVGILSPLSSTNGAVDFGPLSTAYTPWSLHIHTYIHTHILTYMHAYIHTYIQTHTHTYIHTCMHAYIHTYLHTNTGDAKMAETGVTRNIEVALNKIVNTTEQSGNMRKEL